MVQILISFEVTGPQFSKTFSVYLPNQSQKQPETDGTTSSYLISGGEGSFEAEQDTRARSLLHFLLRSVERTKRTLLPRSRGGGREDEEDRIPRPITRHSDWILGEEQGRKKELAAMEIISSPPTPPSPPLLHFIRSAIFPDHQKLPWFDQRARVLLSLRKLKRAVPGVYGTEYRYVAPHSTARS